MIGWTPNPSPRLPYRESRKGDRIQAGDLVYGRFWNKRWIGEGNPGPFSRGHMGPNTGQLVRAYLVRKDGAYDVILPNGLRGIPEAGAGTSEDGTG